MNGYFLLWPNAETKDILGSDTHLTILVVNTSIPETKQIPIGPLTTYATELTTLQTRSGTSVMALLVDPEPCNTLKTNLLEWFGIDSDVYGDKQLFHVTVNKISTQWQGRKLVFDTCTYVAQ